MNKKYTVKEFCEKFNSFKEQDEQLNFIKNEIIFRTYAPVMEKRIILETILDKSIVKSDLKTATYLDHFLLEINKVITLIILYTNIKITKDDSEGRTLYDDYDDLRQCSSALGMIGHVIGEEEIKEVAVIQQSLIENFYQKYLSTEAYVNRFLTNLEIILKSFEESGLKIIPELLKEKKE